MIDPHAQFEHWPIHEEITESTTGSVTTMAKPKAMNYSPAGSCGGSGRSTASS
jgi:hypothetical protein